MSKPSYEEVVEAFDRYVAATSLAGGVPYPAILEADLSRADIAAWEDSIAQANAVIRAAQS